MYLVIYFVFISYLIVICRLNVIRVFNYVILIMCRILFLISLDVMCLILNILFYFVNSFKVVFAFI